MPQVVSFDIGGMPPHPHHGGAGREEEQGGGDRDGEDRSRSNSESSSLYAENMREATATPSEVHAPPPAPVSQRQGQKNTGDATMATGSTPEVSQDPNSEAEMVNYSSGEDEPGESDHTLVETLSQMESPASVNPGDGEEGEGGGETEALDSPTQMAVLRKKVLKSLLEQLYLVEMAGGMRAICFMKLILFIAEHLECNKEDCEALIHMLKTFLKQLRLDREDVSGMVERSRENEVLLLYLRFFNILMSRKKVKQDEAKPSYASNMLWFATARTLLNDPHLLNFCRNCLIAIMDKKQCLEVNDEPTPFIGGATLQPKFNPPLSDLTPFFQRHFVKGTSDIFAAYGRLIAEITLVLPSQLRKMSEVTKHLPTPELGSQWTETLCDFLLKVAQTTGVGRRHVRKLLLQLCGSKESYRLMRDIHALQSFMKNIREICQSRGFDPERPVNLPLTFSYKSTLALIEHLKACDEVACSRTSNWQTFCLEEKSTLPYLFQTLFLLDEGLAPLILQLVQVALSGVPSKPPEKDQPKKESSGKKSKHFESRREAKEAKESKEQSKEAKESKPTTPTPSPDKEKCQALVQLFISFLNDEVLLQFMKMFLLQSNSSSLRWQAHSLLHTLYTHGTSQDQSRVVELLWQMWPDMPTHGWKASQFVDLLGYCTITTSHIMEKEALCQSYVERAIALLKSQNKVVAIHPNSHIYSQLLSIVDFDGYYLENKPCLVCNDPEVPYTMMKLYSMKSEVRYSPKMILFKLLGSFTVSQMTLHISDIKRSKMVKTVNVYYSNRTMQNIIELKNKRSLWLKARSQTLTPGQTEVKIDFPLPIIGCNIIIEFADFYENIQGGSEVLQCPRCQAAVSAHPGVCPTCGENVYQCHKCRAINYDEKDPFLCNSCGFSKYAKFELMVEAKTCSAVDPIENEDDRKKTTTHISQLLEQADGKYKQLVQHRNELDNLLTSLASGCQILPSGRSSSSSESSGVHMGIQLVAQRYCVECRSTYHDLSKVVQGILASRKELVQYDQKKMELRSLPSSEPTTPALLSTPLATPHSVDEPPPFPPVGSHKNQCFSCSSAATEHCITLLKAFALKPQTRRQLVLRKLIQELVDFNLRSGSPQMQQKIRELLCIVSRDDETATAELNKYVSDRVLEHITPSRVTPTLASMVRPEILLLTTSLAMEDSCWEQRLKTVVKLFRKSQDHPSPAVTAAVTMPCLKIILGLINPRDSTKNKDKPPLEVGGVGGVSDRLRVNATDWLREKPGTSFKDWKDRSQQKGVCDMDKAELHSYRLAEKYGTIWKNKTWKLSQSYSTLKQVSWLRSMLFNTSSQSARRATANTLDCLARGEARQRQILDLLCSFLNEVTEAGEHAQEFLELLKKLTDDKDSKWKTYLAMRGVLPKIGTLIGKEIARLLELEETSLSSDLSQGYALKMLTSLLQSFLSVERIKQHFKGKLVGMVLDGYLSLRRLVIQRTKRVDETQELLLSMLEDLTSGAEEDKEKFMALCVQSLNKLKKSDLVTPVFIFERLCNIIRPEVKDVGEFYLSLEKDPQQEEFLQGRMQGNPYPSSTAGLGPLMRDVKNKICTDCELVALLEDDTGMELLVCNKIVSLDLPVKEVFKKIWCAQPNHGDCMRVVYRMRGLLGDATEDIVEKLDDGKGKDVDEEQEFKMAAVLSRCEGLDSVILRLSYVRDFIQGHQLISAALKLLDCCTKLKVNRQYFLQPHLNTVNTLLGVFNLAVDYEDQQNTKLGAEVCEHVLEVTEKILQEASSNRPVLTRSLSQQGLGEEEESQLKTFLEHISAKFVQSNPSVRDRLLHIIPFLTFGDVDNMNILLDYFSPHLDFDQFDVHASPDTRTYFDCFCVVANGIGSDPSGDKLKDLIIEKGITNSAVTYLKTKVPPKLTSVESSEWQKCLALPSIPYVLRMLAGLCKQHNQTQKAVIAAVENIHLLEQVSTEKHIGTLAENVLESMMENPDCQAEIKAVRKATKQEKKRKAMALRKKELGALGMHVNEKGQVVAKSPLLRELGSLEEETGLKCCICLEGYRSHPQKVLGVYTFSKKVTLDEFENKPRKTMGICTVSHFNVVHYDCHSSAVKLGQGRDEWERAVLQNANTKCNGLMPLWGPKISDSSFASSLARHTSYLQESTGIFDPSFLILAHDIRLLLLRFAYEKSFSAESGGGGAQSNMYLIPYLIHIAIYILNSTRAFQREERNLAVFLSATPDKWVHSSYELDGPLYAVVVSLFLQTLTQWKENKVFFLRRLLVQAHTRNSSSSPIKTLSNSDPVEYSVYKPVLVLFSLVDGLQHLLKGTLTVQGADLPHALLDYIRNNDVALLEGCDKLLSRYQDELLPAESFEEMCDVMGLLEDIQQPAAFLVELLTSVSQK